MGFLILALHWRHNGCDGISNHQPHHCLLSRLFRCRSNKTSKLRVTGLCAGNSPVNSLPKWSVTWKVFPFDDIIMVRWYLYIESGRRIFINTLASDALSSHDIKCRINRSLSWISITCAISVLRNDMKYKYIFMFKIWKCTQWCHRIRWWLVTTWTNVDLSSDAL